MSTELLETCRGLKKHIIEEIVRQFGHLPEACIKCWISSVKPVGTYWY